MDRMHFIQRSKTWGADEDRQLLELVDRHGKKWKKIGLILSRTNVQVVTLVLGVCIFKVLVGSLRVDFYYYYYYLFWLAVLPALPNLISEGT